MPSSNGSAGCFSPPALLLGALCAFVACCLAGRLVARRNPYVPFQRFHWFLSPQSHFYPTAAQVRALGRDLLDRDRIAVVIGGSSVMHGIGQRAEEMWTHHLQAELGAGYRVINLAMPGARTTEFGATAAEMLARDFPRLIFLSDVYLNCVAPAPPASVGLRRAALPHEGIYRYFFWDAFHKGLLVPDPARAAAVRAWLEASEDAVLRELTRGMRLDNVVYSRDLWTTLAYTHLSTVWPCPIPAPFTQARRNYPDLDFCISAAQRRTPAYVKEVVAELRGQVALANQFRRLAGGGTPVLGNSPMFFFPPVLRERTLLLAMRLAPDFVARLTPAEQADHAAAFPAFVRELEKIGLAALEVEAGYGEEDFVDRVHLSEAGGRKLAREVAPAVRRLARRLGYERQPLPPAPSPKRRGGERQLWLPLSASGRGLGGGVCSNHGRAAHALK